MRSTVTAMSAALVAAATGLVGCSSARSQEPPSAAHVVFLRKFVAHPVQLEAGPEHFTADTLMSAAKSLHQQIAVSEQFKAGRPIAMLPPVAVGCEPPGFLPGLYESLQNVLAANSAVRAIEKSQVIAVVEERKLPDRNLSDFANLYEPTRLQQLGKLLHADAVVVSAVTRAGSTGTYQISSRLVNVDNAQSVAAGFVYIRDAVLPGDAVAIASLEKGLPFPGAFKELVSIHRFLGKAAKKEGDKSVE